MSEVSLVDGHIDNTMTVREILNAIKSEAIKEFAERLKEKAKVIQLQKWTEVKNNGNKRRNFKKRFF